LERSIVKTVKTFSNELEANLARIALEAAGVPSVVVGVGVAMEGGASGVQVLVPEHCVEAALKVLDSPTR
jgi:phage-related minor tail protein